MTDTVTSATSAPLKITIYPPSAAPDKGRLVNANPTSGNVPSNSQFWGQNGFSFKSFLDIVNPLQHIPVVSTIYQATTGDIPSSGSNITGDTLYGGPVGLMASIANEIVRTQTGSDIGGNLLALVEGSKATQAAQNTTSGTPFLSANQRAAYNAYVKANALT